MGSTNLTNFPSEEQAQCHSDESSHLLTMWSGFKSKFDTILLAFSFLTPHR